MATATAKKDDGMVHGVIRSRISEKAVDAALEKLDIHPSKSMKLEGKVELLVEHFKGVEEKTPDALADCDKCKGFSDPDAVPFCPFCGDGDEGVSGSGEVGDPPDSDTGAADDAGPDEDDEGDQGGAPEASTPPPAAAAPASPASKEQKLVKKERAKKTAAKAEKPAPEPKKDALAKKGTTAVALSDDEAQKILDADVAEVKSLDRELNSYNWKLAQKLIEIGKNEHWKYRKTTDGKVAYRTFEEFAKEELDITREYAQTLMRIGLRFKEPEVIEMGVTKLRAVLNAPAQKQEEAFERLKKGASRRDVEKFAKPKTTAKDLKKTPRATAAETKVPKGGTAQITVAAMIGRSTIQLFKKPTAGKDDETPAKKLGDTPWGYRDLANDVREWFTILLNKKGELVLKSEIKRIEPDGK